MPELISIQKAPIISHISPLSKLRRIMY